jgi:hypothetical protein
LLRHNAEKFEDLRGREAMDCDWGVYHSCQWYACVRRVVNNDSLP